jgi:hypothetical protein
LDGSRTVSANAAARAASNAFPPRSKVLAPIVAAVRTPAATTPVVPAATLRQRSAAANAGRPGVGRTEGWQLAWREIMHIASHLTGESACNLTEFAEGDGAVMHPTSLVDEEKGLASGSDELLSPRIEGLSDCR